MTLCTASEGVSFAKALETDSAAFYEGLAGRFPEHAGLLTSYAALNKKNISNVERAYYGVISDALEGCFAFNLEPDDYVLDVELSAAADLATAVAKALANEETIVRFYTDAAEQSGGTMADVPRAFRLVVKKRVPRLEELQALLET